MDDLLTVIAVVGALAVFIIKAVNKSLKTEPAGDASRQNPLPPHTGPDAVPLPEAWGGLSSMDDLLSPKPLETPKQSLSRPSLTQQHEARAHKPRPTTPARKSPARQGIAPPASPATAETPAEADDFALRSAQEARKAIIWGEILQRKY